MVLSLRSKGIELIRRFMVRLNNMILFKRIIYFILRAHIWLNIFSGSISMENLNFFNHSFLFFLRIQLLIQDCRLEELPLLLNYTRVLIYWQIWNAGRVLGHWRCFAILQLAFGLKFLLFTVSFSFGLQFGQGFHFLYVAVPEKGLLSIAVGGGDR